MVTAISSPTTSPATADVIRRHIKRTLPCELTRDEMTTIAIDAAKKRRRLRELETDLAAEKKRRQQQIDELQAEIDTSDKELDTGEQDRVVLCDEIFRSGTVYTRRSDTGEEVEPRPATAQEAQRYLPAVESAFAAGPNAPLLDQAAARQAGALQVLRERLGEIAGVTVEVGEADGVPDGLDDDAEDDGLVDDEARPQLAAAETPAQRSAREAQEARAERAGKGKNKRGRGGKGRAK